MRARFSRSVGERSHMSLTAAIGCRWPGWVRERGVRSGGEGEVRSGLGVGRGGLARVRSGGGRKEGLGVGGLKGLGEGMLREVALIEYVDRAYGADDDHLSTTPHFPLSQCRRYEHHNHIPHSTTWFHNNANIVPPFRAPTRQLVLYD